MSKRITLTEREIKIIVMCLEENKNDGSCGVPKDIGVAFIQDLIDKLLDGTDRDISLRKLTITPETKAL